MKRSNYFLEAILLAVLLVCSIWFAYTKHTTSSKNYFETRSTIVTQGDTLWRIAKREYPEPGWDLQEVIYYIREVNPGLDPGRLQRGREIRLPVFFTKEVENGSN